MHDASLCLLFAHFRLLLSCVSRISTEKFTFDVIYSLFLRHIIKEITSIRITMLIRNDKGEFKQQLSMEEMVELCMQFLDEVNRFMPKPLTPDEYSAMLHKMLPALKRWRNRK